MLTRPAPRDRLNRQIFLQPPTMASDIFQFLDQKLMFSTSFERSECICLTPEAKNQGMKSYVVSVKSQSHTPVVLLAFLASGL